MLISRCPPLCDGTGDGVSVLADPVDVAVECCEFSARRMSSMQPKWFRKYGAMEGHTVRVASCNRKRRGLVKKIDNDGHCTLQYDGDEHTTSGVRRGTVCLEWQLERSAASLNRSWKRRRGPTGEVERPDMARHVESMAAPLVYPMILRCSSVAAPRAVPAGCERCLVG